MKVLLIGSGGREHALAWALRRSPRLKQLCCAPGNAGIADVADLVAIDAGDVDRLVSHAVEAAYDLVVIGPEAPLVAGLADRLEEAGIPAFGPRAGAARIEGSKVFSKEFMGRHDIPSAGFRVFDDLAEARAHLTGAEARYPLVIKADGLAAGKGVLLTDNVDEACKAAEDMLSRGLFGDAGSRIIVEDRLYGREASFFVLSDGERFVELATCQDYKRALDDDAGLNTGGMGTYSPSVYLDEPLRRRIVETIVAPTIRGLAEEGHPYRGVLYVGVMLTEDGPSVLEYNARFGDPETQVLMPRLDGDWLELLHGCATGRLGAEAPRWKQEAAVCVVMASGGYPQGYEKGKSISGVGRAEALDGVTVFHAGTASDASGGLVTSGGRVLGVTALGGDLEAARGRAYEATGCIGWDGEHHRSDIGLDAIRELAQRTVR